MSNMSRVTRKSVSCICENIDADQLRGNREADQRLCFRFLDSTIPLIRQLNNIRRLHCMDTGGQADNLAIDAWGLYDDIKGQQLSYNFSCPNDHLKSCVVLTIRTRLLCSSRTGIVQCYLQHVYGLRAYDYVAHTFIQYRMATGCLCNESV